MPEVIKEACVEGIDQAIKAEQLGADRIELCARLDLDGLTPDNETIQQAVSQLQIPIRVMIRPREGDFTYSNEEFDQMLKTVALCRSLGVEGVVFGVLNQSQAVDLNRTKRLIDAAGTLKTVFHRAIESTKSIANSVGLLKKATMINAILVSGTGGGRAYDHIDELRDLLVRFSSRELVVCGKITNKNLAFLHDKIGAGSYHGKLIVGDLQS